MVTQVSGSVSDGVQAVIENLVGNAVVAIPRVIGGLVFLAVAYVAIKAVLFFTRSALERTYPAHDRLIVDLFVWVVGVFLWFGAALVFLDLVGMGAIAASLGTATGFVALGISYALSNMIADTVSGVYLLRDPDFNPGDRVTTDSVTGTVKSIELRKSRIELETGDKAVIANRDIEKRWTKLQDG